MNRFVRITIDQFIKGIEMLAKRTLIILSTADFDGQERIKEYTDEYLEKLRSL